ncbi:MAG TPA: glycosyltransferase family 61 protein [Sphingomicrobium sp.]|nr:glycosyltransferase family 61 protein [Sphingomicrobium sp.]
MVADVERIWIPDYVPEVGTGEVRFQLRKQSISPAIVRTSRKLRLLNKLRPPGEINVDKEVFFDVRTDDYFNWSHQVNFYLSLALAARKWLGEDLLIVLPTGMPRITFELYELFGFTTLVTDGPVTGRQCSWSVPHWEVVAYGRKILVPEQFSFQPFDTPRKVFIARRGLRSISNEHEVQATLPGYTKVYTEDLSAAEQFALFQNATHIVSVHGAALAPMQYRSRSEPPLRLIEISPVGHMTRWFGVMCHQIGGRYIQVRGRLKPEYISHLYRSDPYFTHTNDSFEVDPRSLEVALNTIDQLTCP